MNNMNFGIPKVRERKIEKYPGVALLTFHPTGEGLGRKMELSEAAIDLLKLESSFNQVSFSFSGVDIYIVNTSGVENASGLKVGKTTNSFSDKKHYNFIKENMHNLSESDELELFFEETEQEFNGNKVFKLVKEKPSSEVEIDGLDLGQIPNDEGEDLTFEQEQMLQEEEEFKRRAISEDLEENPWGYEDEEITLS